jgi:hypothetical protein
VKLIERKQTHRERKNKLIERKQSTKASAVGSVLASEISIQFDEQSAITEEIKLQTNILLMNEKYSI